MLDLSEVLSTPGARLSFSRTLDGERLLAPWIEGFESEPEGSGEVVNTAGALWVKGFVNAEMNCRCDRCGREFKRGKRVEVSVPVVDAEDTDEAEAFCLEGDKLDIDDLLETVFILDTELQGLCRPDCKGLCPRCGKDLNEGPCDCGKEVDPRLAVLEQLLDK